MDTDFDDDVKKSKTSKSEEILRFLDRYGTVNKDVSRSSSSVKSEKNKFLKHGRHGSKTHATVDLHGQTQEIAAEKLRDAIGKCADNGIKRLLVIHGYGLHSKPTEGPVLKSLVSVMLEHELCHYIRHFAQAAPQDGGAGATDVWLV
jgi:DNA-nicking Smr family endonuclease